MPGTGERAYAYAKACGVIGKSYIGDRIKNLEKAGKLSELDELLFPGEAHNLPEKELLRTFENRIAARTVKSVISIVECFSNPPELLILLIRSYEYADLKNALVSAIQMETKASVHTDIGQYQTVRFNKWPDIKAMIEGTEFEFLLEKNSILYNDPKGKHSPDGAPHGSIRQDPGRIHVETVIDRHYYNALWKSLSSLKVRDRRAAERILSDEISLRNSSWVLRLRTYYYMKAGEVMPHLIDIPLESRYSKKGKTGQSLADAAIHCIDFQLDNYEEWSSWRWKQFVNSNTGERFWHIDPRYFQNAAARYLYRLARRNFHMYPGSIDTIFCFLKMKQFDEDILTSQAEGLGMGLSGQDTLGFLRVTDL